MALPPLATVADLDDRGVTVDSSETRVVETALAAASAEIRDAAGCPISQTTSTVEVEAPSGPWLRLPAPPVETVTEVALDGQTVSDWRLVAGTLWRRAGWLPQHGPGVVTVTYTHGLPTVPEDLVHLVCRIAATTLMAYRSAPDGSALTVDTVTSERIGDYSVNYDNDGKTTEVELSDRLRSRIAARFGNSAGMVGTR
ncbi:hypothetical protein SAMN04487819_11670 [Actinopolyspora alba]|uniref:Uncharacterized protein n=1 Tax=Actinopolyspora alba TaxID=673379 RepID=A0A1I2BEY6_9ACTN|nr:hypothetical protein [Actinopolyspora alba]SFE54715.1 hypothetical protein SAMN04487819_11670 [Actinopolyspora alba]